MKSLDTPAVSIIVLTYNTKELIQRCLDSLLEASTGLDVEIIVVDNGSTDNAIPELSSKYQTVKFVKIDNNVGFGGGNNVGIQQAKGSYIVLLNSDAFFHSGALATAIKHMIENPTIGLGGAQLVKEDGSWLPSARLFPSVLNHFLMISGLANKFPRSRFFGRMDRSWDISNKIVEVDWVPAAFSIIRRDVLNKVGTFDKRFFLYFEEVDLCKRIKAAGYSVCYFPDVVVTHLCGKTTSQEKDQVFSKVGAQLVLPNLHSTFLYYYKHKGFIGAWAIRELLLWWHRLRHLKNRLSKSALSQKKVVESVNYIELIKTAWEDTNGGRVPPKKA
ncbi:MAG: N-acetylglucosaminyl-diphospho-decaprenol L-rhamnosyltransferase [Chlamydiae bacterium]|nr:N-acetylglucosaminyl-diphospho-decaprenol L-rhamnosyltransferase [Chlamydiota bacterium]